MSEFKLKEHIGGYTVRTKPFQLRAGNQDRSYMDTPYLIVWADENNAILKNEFESFMSNYKIKLSSDILNDGGWKDATDFYNALKEFSDNDSKNR